MKKIWKRIRVASAIMRTFLLLALIGCSLYSMYLVHTVTNVQPHLTPDQWLHAAETKSSEKVQKFMMDARAASLGDTNALLDLANLVISFCLFFFGLQILEYLALRLENRAISQESQTSK